LRGSLPPDLRARYEGWLQKLGKDADTDDSYLAALAALDLESEFHKHEALDGKDADARVSRIADDKGVKTKPLATYEAMPILKEIGGLSSDQERACMKDGLDDLDTEAVHAAAAARAWSTGDVAGMKAHYSEIKLYSCFEQTESFAQDRVRVVSDAANAVHESVTKPGKSLIVVGMGYLLRKDGLLDRLAAQGFKIEGPPG
jgi:uncharacterized protein YbaP (TraB family)